MRADHRFWFPLDVRWGDMDAMGHVNNAAYFTYAESARIAFFHDVGMLPQDGSHFGPALAAIQCNFRAQVHYPCALEVGMHTTKIGTSSLAQTFEIFRTGNGDPEDIVADGTSVCVWVDYETGRATPLPAGIVDAIRTR